MSGFKFDPVLPKDSLVLITGITGYIAALTADEVLAAGYRVRGTGRNPDSAKVKWMKDHFDQKYGAGRFDVIKLENFIAGEALDAAMTGKPIPRCPKSMG
jgi:uncharacterized protein YbjT (DUF2867 family)